MSASVQHKGMKPASESGRVPYLLLLALVSGVMSSSSQVQRLATRRSAAFARGGGGCGFCRLCNLDALGRDRFLLVFELDGVLPAVS